MKETGYGAIDLINERIEGMKGTRQYGRLRSERYLVLLDAHLANDIDGVNIYLEDAERLLGELGLTDKVGTASLMEQARSWWDETH